MSNTKKDGDFNLDQELLSKKAAIESGEPLSDDHEDEKIVAENVQEMSDLVDEEYRNGKKKIKAKKVFFTNNIALNLAKCKLKEEVSALKEKCKLEISQLDKASEEYQEQAANIKTNYAVKIETAKKESAYNKKILTVKAANEEKNKQIVSLKADAKNKLEELFSELNKLDKDDAKYEENVLSLNEKIKAVKDQLNDNIRAANKTFREIKHLEFEDDGTLTYEQRYRIHPRLKRRDELINSDVLLSVRNLKQFFFFGSGINRTKLKAVSNISFDVHDGECFGIVGESGCGKTTTGRSIIKLYDITSGSVYYKGYRVSAGNRWNRKEIKYTRIRLHQKIKDLKTKCSDEILSLDKSSGEYAAKALEIKAKYNAEIAEAKEKAKDICSVQKDKIKQIKFDNRHTPRRLVNEIQMIFQDPVDSLDPRMTVEDIIQEGLRIQGFNDKEENHKKVVEMLESVGLVAEHASRYPHEFSGGQRQRIGIARALIMNPKLLICDEPISALDVSIRAQIINLLNELKEKLGLSMIFIAHDLSVVKYFCDRIAVMYYGKIVELATSDELFKNPLHPYTKSLLSAIPKPNPLTEKTRERIIYRPNEVHDYSVDKPDLKEINPGHFIYCNNQEFEQYKKEFK